MDATKKEEMLQSLGTTQDEFTSYVAKYRKFVTETLETDGERNLHRQLGAQKCPPALEDHTAEEIGKLFEDMTQLPGLESTHNTCRCG